MFRPTSLEKLRSYIYCSDPAIGSFGNFADRAREEASWDYRELATGHDAMITKPEELSEHLVKLALKPATSTESSQCSGDLFKGCRALPQIFAMTDDIAERARKIGGTTIRSISDISRHQTLTDNNAEFVTPKEMLTGLCTDNRQHTATLRSVHEVCERNNDVATASLIENWIDETERRTWFLSEIKSDL